MHEDAYYSRFLGVLILHVKRVVLVVDVIVPENNTPVGIEFVIKS